MVSRAEDHSGIDDDRNPVGIFFQPGRDDRKVFSDIDR
jgi:hypothetical protein